MQDNLMRIKLKIGDSRFPITINPEEEEFHRDVAREVDKLYTKYRESYVSNSSEDCALQTAFTFCFELFKEREKKDDSEIMERIEQLTKLIETAETKEY